MYKHLLGSLICDDGRPGSVVNNGMGKSLLYGIDCLADFILPFSYLVKTEIVYKSNNHYGVPVVVF